MSENSSDKKNKINVSIVTVRDGNNATINYDYKMRSDYEKPMALDVLIQAQETSIPDLAFRYGCRARNCGVCTIDINDKPRIACRSRVRDGDKLSSLATLPVLSDLVVRRDGISRQMRAIDNVSIGNELNVEAPDTYHDLTACIECYACLDKCPMHARNFSGKTPSASSTLPNPSEGYQHGNPFTLLKIERIRIDPLTTELGSEKALDYAIKMGLDACLNCPGCKCGVGIDLKRKVIKPLLESAKNKLKY